MSESANLAHLRDILEQHREESRQHSADSDIHRDIVVLRWAVEELAKRVATKGDVWGFGPDDELATCDRCCMMLVNVKNKTCPLCTSRALVDLQAQALVNLVARVEKLENHQKVVHCARCEGKGKLPHPERIGESIVYLPCGNCNGWGHVR